MEEVQRLLESAVEDDDEWVRVLSEIVREKVLLGVKNAEEDDDPEQKNVIRSIRATSEQIINNVLDAIEEEEDETDSNCNNKTKEGGENQSKKEYVDPEPLLAPNYFAWIEHTHDHGNFNKTARTKTTQDNNAIETVDNTHFRVNRNAAILQVDAALESKRAADAEEANAHPTSITADSNLSNGPPLSSCSLSRNATSTSTTKSSSLPASKKAAAAGSLSRTTLKTSTIAPALPVKRYGAAASGPRKSKIKELLGSNNKRKQMQAAARTTNNTTSNGGIGMNRGVTAMRGGSTTMGRLKREDAHRTSAHRAAGKFSSRYQGAGSSKMKMIDINEVKELNVKQQAQNREEAMMMSGSKKRRMQEQQVKQATGGVDDGVSTDAAAAADTNDVKRARNEEFGAPIIKSNKKDRQQQRQNNDLGEDATVPQEQNDVNVNGHSDVASTTIAPPPFAHHQQRNISPVGTGGAPPVAEQLNWHQLLEKSNKINPADRARVEQFFTNQYNPTPNENVYKMKLHEEKTMQPDGSTVKETLYLELDYTTFGFKKLRKIKKK